MSATPTTSPALHIIIRFPTSLPDLPLHIANPSTTTPPVLNQLIRPHLPANLRSSTIRLIHSGVVLPNTKPLSQSLRLPPFPPPTPSHSGTSTPSPDDQQPKVYIHCSLSTPLAPAALASEAALALAASRPPTSNADASTTPIPDPNSAPNPSTDPAPQGFDRLLAAGLTPTEIASLRSQFLALQAHTHTPDTMPSAAEMRALEERWLDGSSAGSATVDGVAGGLASGDDESGLDDMLWGNVIGFFWPMGALFWLMREEGVWSPRRRTAVLSGAVMNVFLGIMRAMA